MVRTTLISSEMTLSLPFSTTIAVRCSISFLSWGVRSSIAPRQVFSLAPRLTNPALSGSAGRSTCVSTWVLVFQAGPAAISSHIAFSSGGR